MVELICPSDSCLPGLIVSEDWDKNIAGDEQVWDMSYQDNKLVWYIDIWYIDIQYHSCGMSK